MKTLITVLAVVALSGSLEAQWSFSSIPLAALGAGPDAAVRGIEVDRLPGVEGILVTTPAGGGMTFTLTRIMPAGWVCRENPVAGFGVSDYQVVDVNADGRQDLVMTSATQGVVMIWYSTGWARCR
jgi:hypothetical protein